MISCDSGSSISVAAGEGGFLRIADMEPFLLEWRGWKNKRGGACGSAAVVASLSFYGNAIVRPKLL